MFFFNSPIIFVIHRNLRSVRFNVKHSSIQGIFFVVVDLRQGLLSCPGQPRTYDLHASASRVQGWSIQVILRFCFEKAEVTSITESQQQHYVLSDTLHIHPAPGVERVRKAHLSVSSNQYFNVHITIKCAYVYICKALKNILKNYFHV
jgi:hypothetical protein